MIGYVLLITFAIIMAGGIYTWMKTYIPTEIYHCPEGASIFVKDYSCTNETLNITLKNNGRFDIGGVFIHISNNPDSEVATSDLAGGLLEGGIQAQNSIIFEAGSHNSMVPGNENSLQFDLDSIFAGTPYLVEIIPVRFQEENGKMKFVSCASSEIAQDLSCVCVPKCQSLGYVCGGLADGCGDFCGDIDCGPGKSCSGGKCITGEVQ